MCEQNSLKLKTNSQNTEKAVRKEKVKNINRFLGGFPLGLDRLKPTSLGGDGTTDCVLRRRLADRRNVCTREAFCAIGEELEVNLGVDGRLAESSLEDGDTGLKVGQADVNQGIRRPGRSIA